MKEMGFTLEGVRFFLVLALLGMSMVLWDGIVFRVACLFFLGGVALASVFYDIEIGGIVRRKKEKV